MVSVIVTDIFGLTPAIKALARAINADTIIDPYQGAVLSFDNESHAYKYFTEHVGIDSYVDLLHEKITSCEGSVKLIGFSVGASAIWQLSATISDVVANKVNSACCYYGSQIRYLTQLSPKFPIQVVFPESEPHFDVDELSKSIVNKIMVTTSYCDYLHGFMNKLSNNFNSIGYLEHIALLKSFSHTN